MKIDIKHNESELPSDGQKLEQEPNKEVSAQQTDLDKKSELKQTTPTIKTKQPVRTIEPVRQTIKKTSPKTKKEPELQNHNFILDVKDRSKKMYFLFGFGIFIVFGILVITFDNIKDEFNKQPQSVQGNNNDSKTEYKIASDTALSFVDIFEKEGWDITLNEQGEDIFELKDSTCTLSLKETKNDLKEIASVENDSYSFANYLGDQVRNSGVKNLTEKRTEIYVDKSGDSSEGYTFIGNEFVFDGTDNNKYKLVLVGLVAGEKLLIMNMSCSSEDWESDGQKLNELLKSIELKDI